MHFITNLPAFLIQFSETKIGISPGLVVFGRKRLFLYGCAAEIEIYNHESDLHLMRTIS